MHKKDVLPSQYSSLTPSQLARSEGDGWVRRVRRDERGEGDGEGWGVRDVG